MLNIRIANPATARAISMELCWRVSGRFMDPSIGYRAARGCEAIHSCAKEKA
jgi:hypothetical protein